MRERSWETDPKTYVSVHTERAESQRARRWQAVRPIKITVLGLRGIPDVQGGVETHAEQLYGRLSRLGCEIEVIVRSRYVPKELRVFGSVRLRRLWAPRIQGLEALVHSLLGVLYAGITRPDILHVHAVGPAIVTPLARLLGLRVVVTHHGPDYERDKWSSFARWVLRLGEQVGMRCAHARIAVSRVIVELVRSKYGLESNLIRNGVARGTAQIGSQHVRSFGLEPGRYFLQVSRLVPEKRQLDLIAAFAAAAVPGWKLALVGALDGDAYSNSVREAAGDAVVLTGFQSGAALQQLYTHAGGFVLPSSHEGLPIALLEALAYGLPLLASDIPANLEVGLDASNYFPLGDREALAHGLRRLAQLPRDDAALSARRISTLRTYDWDHIAEQTLGVYRGVVSR